MSPSLFKGQPIAARRGWQSAIGAMVAALVTATIIADSTVSYRWLTDRGAIGGVVLFGLGLVVGSHQLVGLAAAPMLVSALGSVDIAAGTPWGRSLLLGALWYLASELAWDSIDQRSGVAHGDDVRRLRRREVATVIMLAVIVGSVAAALAVIAPPRTIVIRAAVIAAILVALVLAIQQIAATAGATSD